MRFNSDGPIDDLDDEDPSPEELLEQTWRWSAPDNELPAPVPVTAELARTNVVAVAIVAVYAYTTGMSFDLAVRLRAPSRTRPRRDLHSLLGGWQGADPKDQLLLGVEFSDGRAATTAGFGRAGEQQDDLPFLTQTSGGGSDRSYDQRFWLSPVPPSGPLTFVCAWPAFGIEETQTVIDGGLVTAAAAAAVTLWPWQPPRPEPYEPPEPPLSGWFGRLPRRNQ